MTALIKPSVRVAALGAGHIELPSTLGSPMQGCQRQVPLIVQMRIRAAVADEAFMERGVLAPQATCEA